MFGRMVDQLGTISGQLTKVINLLTAAVGGQAKMSQQLDALKAEVGEVKTVIGQAVSTINDIHSQLTAALAQPELDSEAMQAMADDLKAAVAPLQDVVETPAATTGDTPEA
jgi:predicted  nucleic acid-binding Zn-ribbon protein